MLTRRKRVKYTRQNNISSSESSDCSYLSDDILSNSECQQLNANVDIAINSPSEDLALSDDSEFSASCEEEQHSESLIESQSQETNIELIFACAILFAKLAKNVSKSAMDMILKIVHVFSLSCHFLSSVKEMKALVCKEIDDYTQWLKQLTVCSSCLSSSICDCGIISFKFYHNSLQKQLEVILKQYFHDIKTYQNFLRNNENGDALSMKIMENEPDCLTLHILLSTDGGCLYSSKNSSFWPVFGIILDLPIHIRCIHENILFLALWEDSKPKWDIYLQQYLHDMSQPFLIHLSHGSITVNIQVSLAVFDLPAFASICNIKQYNGNFGCPYCEHPGISVKSGRGETQAYPHDRDYALKSPVKYYEYADLAELGKTAVFGIKGHSVLEPYLHLPENIIIDSMHLLYENCFKTLISQYFDKGFRNHAFYLGRKGTFTKIESCLSKIKVPHDMQKPQLMSKFTQWKAHDLRNFSLYYALPIIGPLLPIEHMYHLFTFIIGVCFANSQEARSYTAQIHRLFTFFVDKLTVLLELNTTLTMHLLLHLSQQIREHGSVGYTSMFPFESQFLHFCRYIQGTQGHAHQICKKINLQKILKDYLSTNCIGQFHMLLNILELKNISSFQDMKMISQHQLLKNNVMYHSFNYGRKKRSQSCFCLLSDKTYLKIMSFSKCDNDIFVSGIPLLVNDNVLSYLLTLSPAPQSIPSDILNTLVHGSKTFFPIVEHTEKEEIFPASSINCHCIYFEVCISGRMLNILSPELDVSEYS